MGGISDRVLIYGAMAGALAFGLWVWHRGAAGVAQDTSSAAVGAVTGAATGTVVGIGQAVGIPATSQTTCQADISAGDLWSASFDCPARDYFSALYQRFTQ